MPCCGAGSKRFSVGHCISLRSPNKRTLYNFGVQGGAAEMLRLAACRLCEAGIVPCMLVHDGILFELASNDEVVQAIEIMRTAGMKVCDGLEVGVKKGWSMAPVIGNVVHEDLFEFARMRSVQAIEIMRTAGMKVCDGLEVGVDIDQRLEYGARYQDKRPMAQKMWATIMDILEAVKAVPRRALP